MYMQAKEIQLALRSGVHSSVAWSLNALTVLSFNAKPPLLLTQHPGLLDALLQAWQTLFSCCCFLSATNAHVQCHISSELTLALMQRQAMQWVLVCTRADIMLLRYLLYIPIGTICCCSAYICYALVSALSQLTELYSYSMHIQHLCSFDGHVNNIVLAAVKLSSLLIS